MQRTNVASVEKRTGVMEVDRALFYLVFALCVSFIFGVGLYCLIDLFRERKRDREVGDEEALIEEVERPARVRDDVNMFFVCS